MAVESIWNLIIYFAICSFMGWIIEQPSAIARKGRPQNLGILTGPFVPIYGFVALIAYFLSLILFNLLFPLQLLIYFIIPTIIEFATSFFLEKFFKIRLWDYSRFKFNLNGRICLMLSILWGIFLVLGVYFFQPFVLDKISKIPEIATIIISILVSVFLLIDFIFSVKNLIKNIQKEINIYIKKGIILNPKIKNFFKKINGIIVRKK